MQCTVHTGRPAALARQALVLLMLTLSFKAGFCQSFSPPGTMGYPGPALIDLEGQVTGEQNEPLANVSVSARASEKFTATDAGGRFHLRQIRPDEEIIFTCIGYTQKSIRLQGESTLHIRMQISSGELDKAVVIAYGTTSRRLNTGSVGKVTAEEIGRQPVYNPLATLQGRIPGVLVTQRSGITGSNYKIQIRGQNSLLQGTDPLFIIDGVPFIFGNTNINQLTTSVQVSPLGLINPADIESIEVLKDADATAIYGSRGANGVVLITTKKGTAGRTSVTAQVYSGVSRVTRTMDMLNLPQYLEMRREALLNDGVSATNFNAPDLLLWDTTRYTDWKKTLIGGTAHTTDAELSLSGGAGNTHFSAAGGYHSETTVFPSSLQNTRASFRLNLAHTSPNKKLDLNVTTSYVSTRDRLPSADLTYGITGSPNVKLIDNSTGQLNWEEGGVPFWNIGVSNILAPLYIRYTGNFQNLLSNLTLGYRILPGLELKANLGYTLALTDENTQHPSSSIDPNSGTKPYAQFSTGQNKSWIIEPQLTYERPVFGGVFSALAGSTWENQGFNANNISGVDYSSDNLLGSINGAGKATIVNATSQYRYMAVFGRLHYQMRNKYIVNLSARRDGSSRFGPANRFANFASAGAGWIFSNEPFLKGLRFLSYGKLRGSVGITGNDQIGNYGFLDTWSSSSQTYQGIPGLAATALFNPDLSWESVRKKEAAIELGAFGDRLLFSAAYFLNRSGNQLASYALPIQTGFSSVRKNFDALIENRGLELTLTSTNIRDKAFRWTTSVNLTSMRNRLLAFRNLATSSYYNTYVVGQPLSVQKLLHYTGVDTATGVYQFSDVDRDGRFTSADQVVFKTTDPDFYGGLVNDFSWKGLGISFTLEFRKQQGRNYLNDLSLFPPGYGPNKNQPVVVLNRWQRPQDVTSIGKFTTTYGSPAYDATLNLTLSDAIYSDASYLRLKNLSLSYDLPQAWLGKLKATQCQIYVHAQNWWTLTRYVGSDPENQSLYVLPPLKTITAGLAIHF